MEYDEEAEENAAETGFEDTWWTHPIVSATEDDTTVVGEIFAISTILFSANSFNTRIRSGYYFWHAGLSLGTFCSTLFVSLDRWLKLDIIKPQDPWLRYEK